MSVSPLITSGGQTSQNVVFGSSFNTVTAGVVGAVISGGGKPFQGNHVTDDFGGVGSGAVNKAGNDTGTTTDAPYSWVGGGEGNTAGGNRSTIGGGFSNSTTNWGSTVGGGDTNFAAAFCSTIPGGRDNTVAGQYGFAAGRRAKANHNGAFVWGDSTDGDVTSSTSNQFTARTVGGARFFSNTGLTTGVSLAPGGGSWSSISDRAVKRNVKPIDAAALLQRLVDMPIATWNYESQDPAIRHVGPMAQDFHAAFSVGEDERYISGIDADGVALAAIQGLYEIVTEQEDRIVTLENTVRKMSSSARVSTLGMTTPALAIVGLIGLVVIGRGRKGGAR